MSESQLHLFQPVAELLPFESAAAHHSLYAGVVVNRPLNQVYYYEVPEPLREWIAPGCRVRVPFGRGNQTVTGYCVEITTSPPTKRRLKSIAELIDREPLLSGSMLELTRWIAERYLAGWGQVIESVVPAGVKSQAGTRNIRCFTLTERGRAALAEQGLSTKQRRILEALARDEVALTAAQLCDLADCGTSPLRTLSEKGFIEGHLERRPTFDEPIEQSAREDDLQLNADQQRTVEKIVDLMSRQEHQTVLLYGVTGSGKTEVYIRAIREVVAYGRQAIVLVPEISLTPQTIRRFRRRFPRVAVLHSHLSDAERHRQWKRIAAGEVDVVVGARSAVFAPTPHLGLIVIDEEHESTFKQQTTPRYHAREVARERTRRERVPLVLGSATPTLESLQRARDKQDLFLTLSQRVEQRPLPPVSVVDLRNDPRIARGQAIGRALDHAIRAAIEDNGQVILFLNLRGYSPLLWCPGCRGGLKCPDCDITLTWHRDRGRLLCHTCELELPPPSQCPVCGQPGQRYLGTGTQRLEEEVRTRFPEARVLRMDSDSMRRPGSHDVALEAFRKGQVDILLGTQMIAKGLDFPNVTLVGVIDADTLLHQPDLRSAERTFQLIAQVAGRTGRGERTGRVIVQTMNPDEPVIRLAAKHDYFGFAQRELLQRQELKQPPFASLARVVVRSENEQLAQTVIREVAEQLRAASQRLSLPVKHLGPAPAPVLKLRKQYRFHLLLACEEPSRLQELWRDAASTFELPDNVEMSIDVDPLDMR